MARTMKGAMLLGPEEIEVRDLPVPEPDDGEIILAVEAATTCGTDVKVFKRGGHPRMLKVPTLFGHEMAGRVAARGKGVTKFTEGAAVVVANSAPCGECDYCKRGRENLCTDLQYLNGAFAEYVRVPARFVDRNTYKIPAGLEFGKAALTEPLACVLHGMDACELDKYGPGTEVVLFGAGPIGLLFVGALARAGHKVILADPNPPRLAVGKELGAWKTVQIERGGGQAEKVKAMTSGGDGAWVGVDASGVPEVWLDAISRTQRRKAVSAPSTTLVCEMPSRGRHTMRKASPMFLLGSPLLSWHAWWMISPTEFVKSITWSCKHSTVSVNWRMSQKP